MTAFEPNDEAALAEEQRLRIVEAVLFAAVEPMTVKQIAAFLDVDVDTEKLINTLAERYHGRGVNLVRRGDGWAFRTAEDLRFLLKREVSEVRSLPRAALETLAIIAYHQPTTRAEIEEVRGVQTGKGTLDLLMEAGWIRMRGRRRTPGRPVTYGTTEAFLDQFSLQSLSDLPGLEDLKGAGLLTGKLPPDLTIPVPFTGPLREDEEPLDGGDMGEGVEETRQPE